jgi:excisionase family DNA binding protein
MNEPIQIVTITADALALLVEQAVDRALDKRDAARATAIPGRTDGNALLRPKEAAEILRCSLTTLRRLDRTGRLEAVRLYGRPRYRKSDLLALVDGDQGPDNKGVDHE